MSDKSQISELYWMIFNEKPDEGMQKLLLKIFNEQNNSIEYIENYLRNSNKFKKLSIELQTELEISELYYTLLNRKPDTEGLYFFKNQLINEKKSIDWVKESIINSDEYKSR
jgi:hypothetical protein